jgi:hypothetical protein
MDMDAVIASNAGRLSAVFVNPTSRRQIVRPCDWDESLTGCREILKLDASTGNRVVREPFNGTITLQGYGVAVATTAGDTVVD